jgi:hypothetical protein
MSSTLVLPKKVPGASCLALVAEKDALAAAVASTVEKLPIVQGISKALLQSALVGVYFTLEAKLQDSPPSDGGGGTKVRLPLKLYCQALWAAVHLLLSWQQQVGVEGEAQVAIPCPAQLRAWVTLGELAAAMVDCLVSLWAERLGLDDEQQQLVVRVVVLVVTHCLTQGTERQHEQQQCISQEHHSAMEARQELPQQQQQQQQQQKEKTGKRGGLLPSAPAAAAGGGTGRGSAGDLLKLTQEQWQLLLTVSDAVLLKQLLPQWLQQPKCLSKRVLQQLLLVGSYGRDPVHYWEGLHVMVARQELEELLWVEAAAAAQSAGKGQVGVSANGSPSMHPTELHCCRTMLGSSPWVAAVHKIMAAMCETHPLQPAVAATMRSIPGTGFMPSASDQGVRSSCIVLSGAPESCLGATAALAAAAMGSCLVRMSSEVSCRDLVAAVVAAGAGQHIPDMVVDFSTSADARASGWGREQWESAGVNGLGGAFKASPDMAVNGDSESEAAHVTSVTVLLGAAACGNDALCDLLQRCATQGWVAAAGPDWQPTVKPPALASASAAESVVLVPNWPPQVDFVLLPSPKRLNELQRRFPKLMEGAVHVSVPAVPAAARLADDLAAVAVSRGSSSREMLEHHCLRDAASVAAAAVAAELARVGTQAAKDAALFAAIARRLGETLVKLAKGVMDAGHHGQETSFVPVPADADQKAAALKLEAVRTVGKGTAKVQAAGCLAFDNQSLSVSGVSSYSACLWPLIHELLLVVVRCHAAARPPLVCRKRRLTAAVQQVKINLRALEEQLSVAGLGLLTKQEGQLQQEAKEAVPLVKRSQQQLLEQHEEEQQQQSKVWLAPRLERLKEAWEEELQQVDDQLRCLLGDCVLAAAEVVLIPRFRGATACCGKGRGPRPSGEKQSRVPVFVKPGRAAAEGKPRMISVGVEKEEAANWGAWVQIIEQQGGFPVSEPYVTQQVGGVAGLLTRTQHDHLQQQQHEVLDASQAASHGTMANPLLAKLLGLSLSAEQLKAARVLGLYPGSVRHLLGSWAAVAVAAAADKPVLLLDPYQQLLPTVLPLKQQQLSKLQAGLLLQEESVEVKAAGRSSQWLITSTRIAAARKEQTLSHLGTPAAAAAGCVGGVTERRRDCGKKGEWVKHVMRCLAAGGNVLLQLSGDWAADEPLVEQLLGRYWSSIEAQRQQVKQKQQGRVGREGGSIVDGLSSAGLSGWGYDAGEVALQQQHQQGDESGPGEGGLQGGGLLSDDDDDEMSGWGAMVAKRPRGPSMIGLRLSAVGGGVLSLSGAAPGHFRLSGISSATTTQVGSSASGCAGAAGVPIAAVGQLLLLAPTDMRLAQLGLRAHELCLVVSTVDQAFVPGPAAAVAYAGQGSGGSGEKEGAGKESGAGRKGAAEMEHLEHESANDGREEVASEEGAAAYRGVSRKVLGETQQKQRQEQQEREEGEKASEQDQLLHPLLVEWSLQQVLSGLGPPAAAKAVAAALAGAEDAVEQQEGEEDTVLQRLSQVRREGVLIKHRFCWEMEGLF